MSFTISSTSTSTSTRTTTGTDSDPDSDAWIWAFVFGDRWISATGLGGSGAVRLYPDSVGWPVVETVGQGVGSSTRLPEEPVFASRSADIADGVVYILATIPSNDGTVVDRYDLSSGQYIGSWEPPVDAYSLSVDRGVVYFLVVPDPYPGVLAAKPKF